MGTKNQSKYLVIRENKAFGPFTATELRRLAVSNRLRMDDLVRRLGSSNQSYVENIANLRALIHSTPDPADERNRGVKFGISVAAQKAIEAYRPWQSYRARGIPRGTFQTTTNPSRYVRAAELLSHGEFDLTTW